MSDETRNEMIGQATGRLGGILSTFESRIHALENPKPEAVEAEEMKQEIKDRADCEQSLSEWVLSLEDQLEEARGLLERVNEILSGREHVPHGEPIYPRGGIHTDVVAFLTRTKPEEKDTDSENERLAAGGTVNRDEPQPTEPGGLVERVEREIDNEARSPIPSAQSRAAIAAVADWLASEGLNASADTLREELGAD